MLGCALWSQALSAIAVIPGVLATASNGVAAGCGEMAASFSIAWQLAQVCSAKARPEADAAERSSPEDVGAGLTHAVREATARRATILILATDTTGASASPCSRGLGCAH